MLISTLWKVCAVPLFKVWIRTCFLTFKKNSAVCSGGRSIQILYLSKNTNTITVKNYSK